MRFTQAEYLAYLSRRNNPTGSTAMSGDGNLPNLKEADLHDQIMAECRRRGWLAIHSRMDRKTTTQCGVPDFIIAMDNGRTLYIEAKAKGKKLTQEQAATLAWLRKLEHHAAAVWSFDDFLKLL